MRPYVHGAYVNAPNIGMQDWETAYWDGNFDRLRKIKQKSDPRNVFLYEQSVTCVLLTDRRPRNLDCGQAMNCTDHVDGPAQVGTRRCSS